MVVVLVSALHSLPPRDYWLGAQPMVCQRDAAHRHVTHAHTEDTPCRELPSMAAPSEHVTYRDAEERISVEAVAQMSS